MSCQVMSFIRRLKHAKTCKTGDVFHKKTKHNKTCKTGFMTVLQDCRTGLFPSKKIQVKIEKRDQKMDKTIVRVNSKITQFW